MVKVFGATSVKCLVSSDVLVLGRLHTPSYLFYNILCFTMALVLSWISTENNMLGLKKSCLSGAWHIELVFLLLFSSSLCIDGHSISKSCWFVLRMISQLYPLSPSPYLVMIATSSYYISLGCLHGYSFSRMAKQIINLERKIETYSLTVLEATSLKSECWKPALP